MSNVTFPVLPGLAWSVVKTPQWSTRIQKTVSGREYRAAFFNVPLWTFKLSYEVLRAGGEQELQQLVGFFNARQGSFDSFLYRDPTDSTVTAQGFGVGDGATTAFQLTRTMGGYTEPIQNVNGMPQIFRNDWQGNLLLYSTPRVNLIANSQDFSSASWGKGGVITISVNTAIAPDGTLTADTIARNSSATGNYADLIATKAIGLGGNVGKTYTASMFLWTASGTVNGSMCISDASYNTYLGSIVITPIPTLVSFTSSGGAGWNASGSVISMGLTLPAGVTVYGRDAQLEFGSVATSRIVTAATSVTVTDYTLNAYGLVTFASAPLAGAALTWTGSFYYRCRFLQDSMDFDNFMQNLWQAKKVEFISVK